MAYIQRLLNLEEEYYYKLPQQNRSEIIRQLIRDYVNADNEDTDSIDIEMLRLEIVNLQNQNRKITVELNSKQAKFDKIIKKKEENRIKQLEEEKQRIEESKKCINCGIPIPEAIKKHSFVKGVVCNGCYLSADGTQIKKWMRGE